jgi:hypothetical protein
MGDTADTEQEGSEADEMRDCNICGSPTLNSPILLRHATGEGTGVDDAVQLRACDTCQMNLANVAWGDRIDG